MSDNLPHMDYRQHRRARRLVHECCNYDEGRSEEHTSELQSRE